ncbi:MAG: hypothetical protein K6C13_12720 [Oscillospiraceae bacterium]|nr:hypothetical protein [Oscillospiraceae bacterium]
MKKFVSMVSAAVIAASMTVVTAVPASAAKDTGWKKAYTDFLKKEAKKNIGEDFQHTWDTLKLEKSFSVYDLDGNKTPELIVFDDMGTHIYTYSGGKVVQMKAETDNPNAWEFNEEGAGAYLWWKDNTTEFWYSPSEKVANSYTTGTGYWFYYFKFKNGKQKEIFSGEQCGPCNLTYNGKVHSYGFDDDPVSYKKFISEISAQTPKDRIHLGYSFRMNDAEISCAISGGNNYKTLYKKFLNARIGKKDTKNFRMKDISGDGIPELFLKTSVGGSDSTKIYTYADNRIVYYGDVSEEYISDNILLRNQIDFMYIFANDENIKETLTYNSNTNTIRLKRKGDLYTCMIFFKPGKNSMGEATVFASGKNNEGNQVYVIDGVTVTKKKYNSELTKFAGNYSSLGKSYKINKQNIDTVIR